MTTPADNTSPEQRAQRIVEDVVSRRRAGEGVSDEDVLRAHPELLGVLERLLRQASIVERVRATAAPAESRDEELFDALGGAAPPDGAAPLAPDEPATEDSARHRTLPIQPSLRRLSIRDGVAMGRREGEFQARAGDSIVPEPTERADDGEIECVSVGDDLVERDDVQEDEAERNDSPAEVNAKPKAVFDSAAELPPVAPLTDAAGTARYRPDGRPPMAVLRVLDDNQLGGQTVRIRDAEFTIGRHDCDFAIPHDTLMSSTHAVIERHHDDRRGWRWTLRDAGSTNGVYARVRRVRLRDGDRLLMGGRRVLFRQPTDAGKLPSLEDISGDRPGGRVSLKGVEEWIGRDRAVCGEFLAGESTIDPRFAHLTRGRDGRWTIRSSSSVNGLWVRVAEVSLASGGMFQLGEQRFAFFV